MRRNVYMWMETASFVCFSPLIIHFNEGRVLIYTLMFPKRMHSEVINLNENMVLIC